ncbi:ABC transporter ATP-binding protein [Xanthomonas hyacinthi]|uniref:ABC transporter ATP-binding protein n=1 Tax=Xanthomonas hyacinthi TaxID=56455 RepID=A0A2S7EN73_9XANT|nr:ABC transporter ATP-binding protein [Xanthomonas hyacinthi]PPU92543.1 ABC transporter ATP-binding protein [Xanthomonas hyacinthi]QGY77913.1 ABC transporter ATP-binding protein [Xanthomonas hyacinthi]
MDANVSRVISLKNATKIFLSDEIETHALSSIDIEIKRGEFVSITGPSGCGKSTLLSILGLLDSLTSGNYFIDGVDTSTLEKSSLSALRNRKIGFIFQSFNLIGDMSVIENIALPLTFRKDIDKGSRIERSKKALDLVELSHRSAHFPAQLSGGQQQRVAIARAIVGEPPIILADEPTGNLDTKNGEVIMQLLRRLNESGSTICMVTHDPQHAQLADRQIHMLDGLVANESSVNAH